MGARETIILLGYLVSAVLFIWGLKGLTHPRTAVRGNAIGALGMLIAIVVTLMYKGISYPYIIAGLVAGSAIGALLAQTIKMTAMPELVALFNGFGGAASVLVAAAELLISGGGAGTQVKIAIGASAIIGTVTLFGSIIAVFKLQDAIKIQPKFPGDVFVTALMALGAIGLAAYLVLYPTQLWAFWVLVGVSTVLGVLLVIPIGGADMPVVVALLNSYSGLAAAATGFVLNNNVLIIAGSLVGASGLILTSIMCKAMNRSLTHVLFGVLAPAEGGPTADEVYGGKVKATSADEVAMLLEGASRVVFVPGYGMAVAQAQHAVRDVANLLEDKFNITVEYAIHPVAGRMPGHMNVLLAEADVPYDKLVEMDEINPTMEQVDVAIVLGANDVVNPVARTDPNSPIAGMPIINVDFARTVIVVKRSLSPGFAGIPNPLFALDNSLMLFGDGKKIMIELAAALKES